jgi:hypothetical protein
MNTTANQIKNLLSKGDSNAKTKKNFRETLILYLSPANQNDFGVNLCPKASEGCLLACLYEAGLGIMPNVQAARIRKSNFLLGNRFAFVEQIAKEINNKAKRTKGELAIRLNGTSDYKLVEMVTSLHEIASNVVFYDYTKIPNKAGDKVLKSGHRYMVCFSRSEDNEQTALEILSNGGISSFVFANELPTTYKGFKVVDGDERDDLMLDIEPGTIIGLRAKGHKAKKDTSGFVIQ